MDLLRQHPSDLRHSALKETPRVAFLILRKRVALYGRMAVRFGGVREGHLHRSVNLRFNSFEEPRRQFGESGHCDASSSHGRTTL